jgi:Domain of unknown function (DUF4192)
MSRRLGRPRRIRRSLARRPEPVDDRVRLRARGAPDLLGLIPFQLGFHPQESLVAVFVAGRTIKLVARMDLPPPSATAGYATDLRDLARQNRVDELVLFAYSERAEPARAFLVGLVEALPTGLVNEALYVDGSRWWSLTCDDSCCPADGTPYDVAGHRLAAEAVFAGMTTRASREELVATVAGPPAAEVQRLVSLATEARAARAGWPAGKDRAVRLLREVRAGLGDPGGLDDRHCAELAVLVEEIRLRDLVWAMIDPESAEQHVRLWQRVVSRVAPTLSAAPLALLGMAGWISGDGALLNCAADELSRRHPRYSMGHLLEQISARAVPPRLWQGMGGEAHADLRRELARLAG